MPNQQIPDFRNAPHIRQANLIITRHHPNIGPADHLGNIPHLSETPAQLGRPTPILGAETNEILTESGYTPAEIANLKTTGAVVSLPTN